MKIIIKMIIKMTLKLILKKNEIIIDNKNVCK